ncbi:1514_t:CDS:2, partial [Ambispora gerdemannii]
MCSNLIDGNDRSGKIEDTINRKDTNNVDDNDGKNTELEMITCIVPTNKGDYKKAIVAEIKDNKSDNNDNMMLVIDGNDESGNLEDTEKYEDMTNGQDTSNVNDNDSIINHVDKNRELGGIIICIVSTNKGNYKKAIITEIKNNIGMHINKDSESDNGTVVIDENDEYHNKDMNSKISNRQVKNIDAKGIIELLVACFTKYHSLIKAIWELTKNPCFEYFENIPWHAFLIIKVQGTKHRKPSRITKVTNTVDNATNLVENFEDVNKTDNSHATPPVHIFARSQFPIPHVNDQIFLTLLNVAILLRLGIISKAKTSDAFRESRKRIATEPLEDLFAERG